MKLSSIAQTIKIAYPLLESFTAIEVTINGVKYQQIQDVKDVRFALQLLKSTNVFDESLVTLDNTVFSGISNDVVNIAPPEYNGIRKSLSLLMKIVKGTMNALENLIPEPLENTIYIKIPNISDLDDFRKTIESFNKVFSLTILHPKIGGQIKFAGVEPGSNWYKVFVKTTTAISLIGGLMWASAVIYKKIQEGKVLEQYVREKELQNEHKKDLVNAHKLLNDVAIEIEAEILYKKYYAEGEVDNEQIERIKTSLKILSDEISRGAEIHPALLAPEEVKNLFPDMKLLPLLESKINKIADK